MGFGELCLVNLLSDILLILISQKKYFFYLFLGLINSFQSQSQEFFFTVTNK